MILYHGSTAYHVLYSIVHKVYYYYDKPAVLMITQYMAVPDELNQFVQKVKETGWFEDVMVVPESEFRKITGRNLKPSSTTSEIEQVIEQMCKLLENWCPYKMEQFEKIYMAADQWTVGTYLLKKQIPYYYMEDASGMLGAEGRYLKIIKDTNPHNFTLCQYLKGAGRSRIVLKKLCDMDNQPEGFFDEKAIDCSIYKNLSRMEESKRYDIIKLYNGKIIQLSEQKRNVLFLTQYHRNLEIKSIAMQKQMTNILMDYFAEDCNLVIKPHPKDRYLPYGTMFPDCKEINCSVPSELLPFMLKGNLDCVITPNSTSIGGLRGSCDTIWYFGENIEVYYERLHMYYVVCRCLQTIRKEQTIYCENGDALFLKNFFELFQLEWKSFEAGKEAIVIDGGWHHKIENGQKRELTKEDTIFFLEFEERYSFLRYDWIKSENMLECEMILTDKDGSQKKKSIWFYSPDPEMRKGMKVQMIEKDLINSKQQLQVSVKEVMEKRLLEGKVRALEYALQKQEHQNEDQVLLQAANLIEQYKTEKHFVKTILEQEGLV